MSKWIHTTLNDICRSDKGAIISGPFGSNISSKFFVLDGVPVIRGNNLSLSLDKFYDDDFVFVTEEKADELNCYAEEGDLIFTAAGTIGQVGILEAPLKYKKYVISNKQLRARIDTRKVDLLYAYYLSLHLLKSAQNFVSWIHLLSFYRSLSVHEHGEQPVTELCEFLILSFADSHFFKHRRNGLFKTRQHGFGRFGENKIIKCFIC